MSRFRSLLMVGTLSVGLMLSACAEVPKDPQSLAEYKATNDPLEPMNRTIFDVNDFLDRLLIRPLAELYRVMVPPGLRDRVTGIVTNMREPVILVNNVLQGELTKAGTTLERFGVNTVAGVGGMFDVADGWGLPQQTGDFGQTLSVWGVGSGPYLVLPLFGPSNARDAVGMVVDMVMSPWGYIAAEGGHQTKTLFTYSSIGADALTRREQNIEAMDALRSGSLDFYAQMRSVMQQYRAKQLGLAQPRPNFADYTD